MESVYKLKKRGDIMPGGTGANGVFLSGYSSNKEYRRAKKAQAKRLSKPAARTRKTKTKKKKG